jgi:hypothetical protein
MISGKCFEQAADNLTVKFLYKSRVTHTIRLKAFASEALPYQNLFLKISCFKNVL